MKLIASLSLLGFANCLINFDMDCESNPDFIGCQVFAGQNGDRAFGANLQATIETINESGCWCYFTDDHGRGKGQPVDGLDEICKVLHDGYECAMRDAEEEGTTCVPWEVDYVSAVGGVTTTLADACITANPVNLCAARACAIEGTFVESILGFFVVGGGTFDDTHKHANGFNPKTDCPVKLGGGGPSPKKCCGEYPIRFPFKTLGGDRGCCGSRTFSTLTLSCCDADASVVKFNC